MPPRNWYKDKWSSALFNAVVVGAGSFVIKGLGIVFGYTSNFGWIGWLDFIVCIFLVSVVSYQYLVEKPILYQEKRKMQGFILSAVLSLGSIVWLWINFILCEGKRIYFTGFRMLKDCDIIKAPRNILPLSRLDLYEILQDCSWDEGIVNAFGVYHYLLIFLFSASVSVLLASLTFLVLTAKRAQ